MASPRFSLIVPVHDDVEHLEECLDSLSAQTLDSFEVIVVDDGSRDEVRERIDQLVRRDKRMRMISIVHRGTSAARNAGIGQAVGDFAIFVDADDMLESQAIEVIDAALADGVDLLWFGFSYLMESGGLGQGVALQEASFETAPEAVSAWIREDTLPVSACNKAYRLAPIKEYAIRFRDGFPFGEDRLFNLDFLQHCGPIGLIPDNLYVYRLREGSASHRYVPDMLDLMLRIHDERMEALLPLYAQEASEDDQRAFKQADYVKSVQKAWLHLAEYYERLLPDQREQALCSYLALGSDHELERVNARSRSQALWLAALRRAVRTRSLLLLRLMMAVTRKRLAG